MALSAAGNPSASCSFRCLLRHLNDPSEVHLFIVPANTFISKNSLMQGLTRLYRLRLRNEIPSILPIIIGPAVHFRDIARPVAMPRVDRRGPFQCIGTPWICCPHLSSLENGIEKVEHKHQVHCKYDDRHYGNEFVQVIEFVERGPYAEIHITAGYPSQTHIVHGPENKVSACHGHPEMDVAKCIVQVASKHFREPVVYTRKHAEECGYAHYDVKVGHYKIGIVHMNINGGITHPDAGESAGNEQAYKANGKQH